MPDPATSHLDAHWQVASGILVSHESRMTSGNGKFSTEHLDMHVLPIWMMRKNVKTLRMVGRKKHWVSAHNSPVNSPLNVQHQTFLSE